MSRLHDAFARAAAEHRAALIAYFPAGFPTVAEGYELIRAIIDGGADIVEVGWPYSDPLMDGPTIQRAVELAAAGAALATGLGWGFGLGFGIGTPAAWVLGAGAGAAAGAATGGACVSGAGDELVEAGAKLM